MIIPEHTATPLHRFGEKRLGLGKLALSGQHEADVVDAGNRAAIIAAAQLSLTFQSFAERRFSFGELVLRLQRNGQLVQRKVDRFQIDPVFEGSTLSTFRTTIGKQITQDLAVTSSISLDSSKQPIIRIEWQATNTIIVQLVRDDNGIVSLTFRKRQRL